MSSTFMSGVLEHRRALASAVARRLASALCQRSGQLGRDGQGNRRQSRCSRHDHHFVVFERSRRRARSRNRRQARRTRRTGRCTQVMFADDVDAERERLRPLAEKDKCSRSCQLMATVGHARARRSAVSVSDESAEGGRRRGRLKGRILPEIQRGQLISMFERKYGSPSCTARRYAE